MTNITIPPEAHDAACYAYADVIMGKVEGHPLDAAILAALKAWPGIEPHKVLTVRDNGEGYDLKQTGLILPLPTEADT